MVTSKNKGTSKLSEYKKALCLQGFFNGCPMGLLTKKETLPFGDVSFWVPARTRTVDIQNHKQVVESLGTPVFIGISAFPLLAFAPILRRIFAEL